MLLLIANASNYCCLNTTLASCTYRKKEPIIITIIMIITRMYYDAVGTGTVSFFLRDITYCFICSGSNLL